MERTVLGIDPGFSFTGFGILRIVQSKTMLIDCGYLRLSPKEHLSLRIEKFFDCFSNKIIKNQVTDIALETPFLGKNVQTFLKLGYLRGILYLLASQHKLSIQEFAPREVKNMLTGFGGASKDQVARMVFMLFPQLLQLKEAERNDLTDAVAVTLCGLWHRNVIVPGTVTRG